MKLTKLSVFICAALLWGCASEEEKIHSKQVETCKENIRSGQEPTPFCLNLLPEYRGVAGPQQQTQAPQYIEQPPVQQMAAQPPAQPVIVQSAAQPEGSRMTDMLVGGLVGHAIGSSGGSNANYAPPPPAYDYRSRPKYVTNNTTIIQKPAPTPVPVPATRRPMDMSKLNAYGSRPSAPATSSSKMNMGALSASAKRK